MGNASGQDFTVPEDLEGLELYERDGRLCRDWSRLKAALEAAYPEIDVVEETREAHAWEVANPSRRKRNRPRFLHNWMKKARKIRREPASRGRRRSSRRAAESRRFGRRMLEKIREEKGHEQPD